MKIFEYTNYKGTKVKLTVFTSDNIEIEVNKKKLFSKGKITYDFSTNPPIPALVTEYKIKGKKVCVGITEEIRKFLKELKEEEEIAKFPFEKQLKKRIQKLKEKITFTKFLDIDYVTGWRYYILSKRVDKKLWKKISHFFQYIDTEKDEIDLGGMAYTYKGWVTTKPDEVEKIIKEENKKEYEKIENEIKTLEEELKKYEEKIKKEKELKKEFKKIKEQK